MNNWQTIAKTLAELIKEVVASMKKEGYRGRSVTLKIRFNNFKTYTGAKTLARFSDSEEEIRRAVFDCLHRIELTKKVRLVGVRVNHFEDSSAPS